MEKLYLYIFQDGSCKLRKEAPSEEHLLCVYNGYLKIFEIVGKINRYDSNGELEGIKLD